MSAVIESDCALTQKQGHMMPVYAFTLGTVHRQRCSGFDFHMCLWHVQNGMGASAEIEFVSPSSAVPCL